MDTIALALAISFLIGSLPFGLWVARAVGGLDIRGHGSGNIGTTNVWRTLGPRAGALVFLLDALKGVIVVVIGASALPESEAAGLSIWRELLQAACGLSGILGHIFSPLVGFKGGKGVATALGVFMSLLPAQTLVALGAFLLTVALTRYISLGSIVAASTLALFTAGGVILRDGDLASVEVLFTTTIAIVVLFTHRKNIRRLARGEERKFSLKRDVSSKNDEAPR